MKQPRPLAEMLLIAQRLQAELAPYTTRIEIAGSIRRRAPMVSDVELVCVPKFRSAPSGDLFAPAMENLLDEYIAEHRERYHRRLDKNNRVACGTKYKRLEVDGVPLDLFSVLGAAEWGGDLSDPNRAVGVQQAGRLAAVQGRPTAERLRGEGRCGVASCQAGRGNVDQPLPMPEESDFFALLGIDYLPPELRR